jgi:two-component system sensor histidine kinase/response regulator
MVTAHGREDVMKQAPAAGIEDVLIKPVPPSLLFDTLMRVMGSESYGAGQASLPPRVVAAELPADRRGARVLVVEDNAFNQEVAVALLRDAGLLVDLAGHGAEAIEKLEAAPDRHYDLVLMDMQMPVMDGVTATRTLRRRPRFADLPIVAMTANVMESERRKCLDAGMNDHVAKPIEPLTLFAVLAKWIKPRTDGAGVVALADTRMASAPVPIAPVPIAPASSEAGIRAIEGLDVDLGLRRVMGKQALYFKLLGKFAADQADAARRLTVAWEAGDAELALRLAHTAKGLAGNIGASELQESAAALEAAIRDASPRDTVTECLRDWGDRLRKLIPALRAALAQAASGPNAAPVRAAAPEHLAALVRRLETLLRDADGAAVDLIDEEEAALAKALGTRRFAAVATAARDIEVDVALNELNMSDESSRKIAL